MIIGSSFQSPFKQKVKRLLVPALKCEQLLLFFVINDIHILQTKQ